MEYKSRGSVQLLANENTCSIRPRKKAVRLRLIT
jgi:hypothetical protein